MLGRQFGDHMHPRQLIDTLIVTNLILVGEIELGKTLDLTVAIG